MKNYVDLLECRFLQIQIGNQRSGSWKSFKCLLTLQPLVENSIGHGLENLENGGTITISAFESEDNEILISVKDNGVGIPAEKLKEIRDHLLHSESLKRRSILVY
ncbi:MAG: sensor histidine kinase [[Clostridium] leptum]